MKGIVAGTNAATICCFMFIESSMASGVARAVLFSFMRTRVNFA
jgi:hypothetical protein